MSLKPRVTMREIAAKAGVSHATVSLAFRNHPSIPAETRDRIKKLARAMGFERDPMLAALNVYRQKQVPPRYRATLAWLNIWPSRGDLESSFENHEFREGAEARCAEFGYVLEDFWLHEAGMTPARMARIFNSRQIQGIFLPPAPTPDTSIAFPWGRFSIVAFGYSYTPVFHLVANAQYRSARIVTARLLRLGYRRIAFLSLRDITIRTDYNFHAGYVSELAHADLTPLVFPMTRAEEMGAGKKRFANWFRRKSPDAIIVPSLWYGKWITDEIRLAVPGDVAVAALSVRKNQRQFAGIYQSSREIGMAAVDQLIGLITRNERGIPSQPLRILVEGEWQDGASAPGLKS